MYKRQGDNTSGVLKNSYEKQEQITFYDEINYAIDMMSITKKLSNIPIEFQEGNKQLPETITFLEMEKVGKVEQLNILNRWNMNCLLYTSLPIEVVSLYSWRAILVQGLIRKTGLNNR